LPQLPFLRDLLILLAAAVGVLTVSHALRLPAVVGFLVTGLLIGPSGLGLIGDREMVGVFAEIGIVFLLFSIGLEFSIDRLRRVGRAFLLGGSLQTGITILAGMGAAIALGSTPRAGVFFGGLLTLSSTAIVLKLYADRGLIDSVQGKLILGILLFQDFLLVPMIILLPVLAGTVPTSLQAVALRFGAGLVVVAVVFGIARTLMPRLLYLIVRTRVRELLVLGALLTCFGMAWVTARYEFSLAAGAFLAGILISESEYSHQVTAEMIPFRDLFTSVFFISIGMLLDIEYAATRLDVILLVAGAVVLLKALLTGGAVGLLRYPVRTAAIVGVSLAQIGEFSFVLARLGRDQGLLDPESYQMFLATAIVTMMATPFLVQAAPALAARLRDWVGETGRVQGAPSEPRMAAGLGDHVVIVGFGVNGRNLAATLKAVGIKYVVIELSGEVVRRAGRAGEPILYGDATRPDILRSAGIDRASVVVFGISDSDAARQVTQLARQLAPNLHIIVRTRLVAEIEALYEAGANDVVAEEFETSIEILSRVLERYHVPPNVIEAQGKVLRGEHYRRLRAPSAPDRVSDAVLAALAAGTTSVFYVRADSPADGRKIRELDLRSKTGVTVIAVVRDGRPVTTPPPEHDVRAGDALVLVGSHPELARAFRELEGG
jgi:CPA2 family monovalent cation:H+ antiporter-2